MLQLRHYLYITSVIFALIGLVHVIRLIFELGIVIAGYAVPLWVSIIGVIGAWYLSLCAFSLAKKIKQK